MPIRRTYQCGECFVRYEVELPAEHWDAAPPSCPACDARELKQEFRPIAIGGSVSARANKITEDILEKDYHVSDIQRDRHEGATPKVNFKDQTATVAPSNWTAVGREALEMAIANGRQTRLEFGSGLDVLQSNLKSGAQPDLIEVSKRRSARVW